MNKRFVKLGDKYYYIEASDKGLHLVPASADDVLNEHVEQATLVDPNVEAGDNFLQEIIDESKEELVKHLKLGLKQTVLASLGFEKDTWGRNNGFKVDHCNGRMSEVTNHISVTLKQILRNVTVEELGITEEERKDLIAAYRADLLDRYRRELRDDLWNTVAQMAHEDAKTTAESLLKDRQQEVATLVMNKLLSK
jgi:DNA-binding transcriptional ArsR family regulator